MRSGLNDNSCIESSIVPWVLPREDIPISIKIPKNMIFDEIRLKLPSNFKFVDFVNIADVEINNSQLATIKEIIKTKHSEAPNFFGFVVVSTKIPETLKTSKKILVEICLNNIIVEKIELIAKIFRPKLEITDIIDQIELNDDRKVYKVPMNLKYIGFGDIKLAREASIQGRIVSQGESLIDELLRRIYREVQQNSDLKPETNHSNLHFEDKAIKKITEEIEKKIFEGNIEDVVGNIEPAFFKQYFETPETKTEFLKIVYTRLDDVLINFLTDIVDKHPTDNVSLEESHTSIYAKIDSRIDKITIRVLYKDKLDNEYPPVEIPIKIVDKRIKSTEASINMPMLIKKWEEEPFMNVADMEIEEDF